MAENWTRAFGRYLKMLRERRNLSLEEVSSLSQPFPDPVSKSYMSRCENGHHRPALSKIIALSRIFEVPAEVLLERLELDMGLDRVGGPPTEGKTFAELSEAGAKAYGVGHKWHWYAFVRDALPRASEDPVEVSHKDRKQQLVRALMRCAGAAKALGKTKYALHELLFLEMNEPDESVKALILDRISTCYRSLGKFEIANTYCEKAVLTAESSNDAQALAYIHSSKALLALQQSDLVQAAEYYQTAYRLFKEGGNKPDCALTLNNLAHCYFGMGRHGAARRAARAAEKLSRSLNQQRSLALSLVLLGELDEREQRNDLAAAKWRAAVNLAQELDDKELRFKAEALMFRQAFRSGNIPTARAIRRRLRRLEAWMPFEEHEDASFKALFADFDSLHVTTKPRRGSVGHS